MPSWTRPYEPKEEALSPNFGHDKVMSRLIHNRIPREWVYHAYPYGYQFLCQHLRNGDRHYDDNVRANNKRLDALETRTEPAAYPPWDGWYHPSPCDLVRIPILIQAEEQRQEFSRDSHLWVAIGEDLMPRNFPMASAAQQLPQPSSSASADHDMGAPAETSNDVHAEETSPAPAHVSGFLELPMAQVTLEAQDVDMHAAGAEEEASTVSLDAPEDASAGAML